MYTMKLKSRLELRRIAAKIERISEQLLNVANDEDDEYRTSSALVSTRDRLLWAIDQLKHITE